MPQILVHLCRQILALVKFYCWLFQRKRFNGFDCNENQNGNDREWKATGLCGFKSLKNARIIWWIAIAGTNFSNFTKKRFQIYWIEMFHSKRGPKHKWPKIGRLPSRNGATTGAVLSAPPIFLVSRGKILLFSYSYSYSYSFSLILMRPSHLSRIAGQDSLIETPFLCRSFSLTDLCVVVGYKLSFCWRWCMYTSSEVCWTPNLDSASPAADFFSPPSLSPSQSLSNHPIVKLFLSKCAKGFSWKRAKICLLGFAKRKHFYPIVFNEKMKKDIFILLCQKRHFHQSLLKHF